MNKLLKKLESLDPGERDHIKKMLAESKKEKEGSDNLGWMYKGAEPETEEYLLGRRVDKHIDNEKELQTEAEKKAPGATFTEAMARRADLDMQTKMREDPLFAIRKKEEDAKRRLLANPIRMKQLQKTLDAKKAEMKAKKKKKKHKHKKSSHEKGSDDGDSDDDDLIKKYLAILESKKRKNSEGGEERVPRLDDDSDEEEEKKKGKHKAYGLVIKGEAQPRVSQRSRSRSKSRSPKRSRAPKQHKRRSRSRSQSPKRHRSRSPWRKHGDRRQSRSPRDKHRSRKDPPKKMDEETARRLREEMMQNAEWRNEQRINNVKKYKEQDQKEREQREKEEGKDAEFLKPIMSEHVSQSSVEDRLKRNRYNIQRTKAAIDKNFTKKH